VAGVNAARKSAVWDAASGRELCVLSTAGGRLTTRAFAPDGKTLYTGEWEGPVRAWDVSTGKELPAFDKGMRITRTLVVSPDGRRLAAADHPQAAGAPRREITVWALSRHREAHRLLPRPERGWAWDLAFSPDGNLLAAVGGVPDRVRTGPDRAGFIMLWDLRTGKEWAGRTDLTDELMAVAFSADGRLLATGGEDGSVRLWEAATGQQRHRFTGHMSEVHGVAFSPDGKLVAAASPDAPVFVWDVTGCYGRPPSATPFSREEGARLWNALRDVDAAVAFKAMRTMMARPGPAVALLRDRLRPVPAVREGAVRRLLRDLDASDFTAREKAASDLNEIADRVEPLLRKALAKKPSAEAKRRIERALEAVSPGVPARRREARAVEVLERVGTPEARELLGRLAGGAKGAWLTREAKSAIERMKKRR
jgi:WD40 repeat protein